jgi:hypothetical protein
MSAEEILAGLYKPGRDVAFVDETGTSKKPLSVLAGDFCLICAVVIPSEKYQHAKVAIQKALRDIGGGVRELHATEIVNPGSSSAWKGVPLEKRLAALHLGSELLVHITQLVAYIYVSGEQYYAQLVPQIEAAGVQVTEHKAALKKVFFACLLERLRRPGREVAVVLDSETPIPDAIKIQGIRKPEGFYEGGVIYAESWVEEGLQLADLAAYTLNRIFHVKQRRLDGKSGLFDGPIETLHERLRPKLVDLLVS